MAGRRLPHRRKISRGGGGSSHLVSRLVTGPIRPSALTGIARLHQLIHSHAVLTEFAALQKEYPVRPGIQ